MNTVQDRYRKTMCIFSTCLTQMKSMYIHVLMKVIVLYGTCVATAMSPWVRAVENMKLPLSQKAMK